jgi:hypothetical protein
VPGPAGDPEAKGSEVTVEAWEERFHGRSCVFQAAAPEIPCGAVGLSYWMRFLVAFPAFPGFWKRKTAPKMA